MSDDLKNGTLIIGLGHKRRNGKDEAAKSIIMARGARYDVRRYAFADALKREVNTCAELSGGMFAMYTDLITRGALLPNGKRLIPPATVTYDPEPFMGDPLCPLGKQVKILQWWGTEYRRKYAPNYWVTKLRDQIAKDKPQVALITDMRYPNEAFFVQINDGITVKVSRQGYVDLDPTAAAHSSENALNGFTFDYEIQVADGRLEDLQTDAVKLFDLIVDSLNPPHTNFTMEYLSGSESSSVLQVV